MEETNTIEALEQQRQEITERAANSIDPYLATLSAALHDEEVFDFFRQAENLLTLNRTILYLVPLAAWVAGTWLNDARRAADAVD